MRREPYASARRVFWLVDQGSSHRPTTFPDRLREMYSNALAVPLPVHASWLNQIEIYFSILERKALTPNDFPNLAAVMERIHAFERIFNRTADPFAWTDGIAWHRPAHRAVMASVRLGAWMSAALDDPQVCEEMKADINEWFSAGEPMEILGQALSLRPAP